MKKLINIFLILALVLSSFTYAFAQPADADEARAEFAKSLGEHSKENLGTIEKKLEKARDTISKEKVSIIVELEEKPILEEKAAITMGAANYLQTGESISKIEKLQSSQNAVKKAIKTIDSNAEFGYRFNLVVNGFEVKVSINDVDTISKLPGVKSIHENRRYMAPKPQMVSSIDMVFPNLQGEQEYKGTGTAVAVIDTGVAVDNVLMRLSTTEGMKIDKGYVGQRLAKLKANEFSEETLTAEALFGSDKIPFSFDYTDGKPDASTDATAGGSEHGVHVSGTIAANKNGLTAEEEGKLNGKAINGVAPEAQILGMKVFSADNETTDEWIFAAVEDAITLGADAINLSLGSTCGFTLTNQEEPGEMHYAFERARKAGVVVAVAASNDNRTGEGGLNNYESTEPLAANPDTATVGDPSTKKYATTVASFENDKVTSPYLVHNGRKVLYFDAAYPENRFEGSFEKEADGKLLVDCKLGKPEDFTDAVKGNIAFIKRGEIAFSEKVYNAAKAGASACIIYNNAPGKIVASLEEGVTDDGTPLTNADLIPTVTVFQADGEAMLTALDKPVEAKGNVDSVLSEEKGMMSSFSSWGATPDLKLKPEILAPGGQIYSTVSNNKFVTMSGTSMATPHVAGGAAVVRNYLNSKNFSNDLGKVTQVAEALLMSTAIPQVDTQKGINFSPRQQGAGLMNLTGATQSLTYILSEDTQKAKVELGDKLTTDEPKTFTFTVYNDEAEARTYTLSGNVLIEESIDRDGTTFIANTMKELSASKVTFDSEKITVPANGTKTVKATITLNPGEMAAQSEKFINGFFVEGFVKLASSDTNTYPNLGVPYMGFYGDWDKAPLFEALNYKEDIEENDGIVPFFENTRVYSVDGSSSYAIGSLLFGGGKEFNMVYLGNDISGEKSGSKYIAISPKDYDPGKYYNVYQSRDFAYFSVDMLRSAKSINFRVEDSEGNLVSDHIKSLDDEGVAIDSSEYRIKSRFNPGIGLVIPGIASFVELYDPEGSTFYGWDTIYWDGTDSAGKYVDDGQYYIVVSGQIDYEGAKAEELRLPVKVDNTKPTAVKFVEKDDAGKAKTIEVRAEDNYHLDYIEGTCIFKYELLGSEVEKIVPVIAEPLKFAKEGKAVITQETLSKAIENCIEEFDGYFKDDPDTQARFNKEIGALTLDDITLQAVDAAANRTEPVEKTLLTVKAEKAEDKVYDGTKDAKVTGLELTPNDLGLVEGTDYTVKAEFAQADVGENIPVSFTFELIENEKTKDLLVDNQVGELKANITPKELVADPLKVADKVYDGKTDAKIAQLVLKGAVAPLELGKDYEAAATFDSANAGKDVPVTVNITLNNPNYIIKSPIMTKATINKADRDCPLKYKVDIANGKYTITIEPVEGAEYNFGGGWTKSNVFVTEKSGKITLSIRIPGDNNYNEALTETTIKLTQQGAVPTGDDTQIVIWIVVAAAAIIVALGICVYVNKKKKQ